MVGEKPGEELAEKRICVKCSIVFPVRKTCPRCGRKDSIDVYFEALE